MNQKSHESADVAMTKFDFHGDELDVIQRNGTAYVAVRRVCEALGIDESGQRRKLTEKTWACAEFISAQMPGDDQAREFFCLPFDSLPMWLATIEPSRVAEHVRPKLELYQRECARVLADHFLGRRGAAFDIRDLQVLIAEGVARALPAALAALCPAITAAFAAGQTFDGTIGASRAERLILTELRTIADHHAQRGSKAWRAEHRRLQTTLRDALLGVGSRGAWRDLPERLLGDIRLHLRKLRQDAERLSSKQAQLFNPASN